MMSKTPTICDSGTKKERTDDYVDLDFKEKGYSGPSLKTYGKGDILKKLSPVKLWQSNIADNDGLSGQIPSTTGRSRVVYKLYKRRWVGLAQLALLNLLFGWNWLMLFSMSDTTSEYFGEPETSILALAISHVGTLCSVSPLVIWVLHRHGSRPAFFIAGSLLALGGLIQYSAAISKSFGAILLANVLFGAGASFAVVMPTHYSDLWFSQRGRMGATAFASVAFLVGSKAVQVAIPLIKPTVDDFPLIILITSSVSVVLSLGTFLVTAKPPTPPSPSRSFSKVPLLPAFVLLIRSRNFWPLLIPFAACFGLACCTFSRLSQIFNTYENNMTARACSLVFICSGLITIAILSPITTIYNTSLSTIKTLYLLTATCYLVLIWIPEWNNPFAATFVVAVLGGASFSLIPITLEFLVDITHPIAPESTSSLCWVAALLLSAWLAVIMETMGAYGEGVSPHVLKSSLVIQAAVSLVTLPLPFFVRRCGQNRKPSSFSFVVKTRTEIG